jgi:hypothetical protein
MHLPGLFLGLFFLGQNCLHHVAGLGDVREVNLRGNCLLGTRGLARPFRARKLSAHLFRFITLE